MRTSAPAEDRAVHHDRRAPCPSTSSMATETTVMITVFQKAIHQYGEVSTDT